MSLCKSCGILRRFVNTAASNSKPIGLRRFLNTAASDSKPILDGSQQTILKRLADRAKAYPSLVALAKVSIITGCIGVPIASLVDDSITKARVENFKREALENLEKKVEEYWRGQLEELKITEEEVDKEFNLAIQELKKQQRLRRRSIYY